MSNTLAPLLADSQANLICIYLGHRDMRVAPLPAGHLLRVRCELCVLCRAMQAVLEAPTVSHSRHVLTPAGRRKHAAVSMAKRHLHARITVGFGALSAAARDSVSAAPPGGADASRLAQYLRDLVASWENLRYLKSYRTPQTTRAYAHVAVWAHPFIMGPYYAWVAGVGGTPTGGAANLGFALFLAVATAVSLSALLNARYVLEDPFVSGPLDTVRVGKELRLVQHNLWAMAAAGGDENDDVDAKRNAAAADACCGVASEDERAQQPRGALRVTVERAAPAPP